MCQSFEPSEFVSCLAESHSPYGPYHVYWMLYKRDDVRFAVRYDWSLFDAVGFSCLVIPDGCDPGEYEKAHRGGYSASISVENVDMGYSELTQEELAYYQEEKKADVRYARQLLLALERMHGKSILSLA